MALNTYALITLDDVKEFSGKEGMKDNDLLEDLINRYSTMFETYIERNILSREYTEYQDGRRTYELFTKQYPITTVSGVYDDSAWAWASSTEVDSSYYRISNDERSIVFWNWTLGNYRQNVKIIYTAGYSSTPEDIKHACVTEVARAYKNRTKVDVTSQTLPDGSIAYSAGALLPQTVMVLDKYKKSEVV
jgi:hypothetical protein